MERFRTIHPSATIFAAVLLALLLPFGHAVESCGSRNADFTAVELLTGGVEPNPSSPGSSIGKSDQQFADELETTAWPFAAALAGLAMIGLVLAVLSRGRFWGTCCALIAVDVVVLAFAVNLDDAHAGWHIAFWVPAGGAFVRFLMAVNRWFARRSERLAANDTTPELPLLR